jgi:hypothetical protein
MFCFHMPALLQGKDLCRYIFMAMYSFLPPFYEAKFCCMPSCVVDKLWCAAGERRLRNTEVAERLLTLSVYQISVNEVLTVNNDHIHQFLSFLSVDTPLNRDLVTAHSPARYSPPELFH